MTRSCILILILILISSCRNDDKESLLVIDTQTSEPSEMKLSQLFESNGMVVLETNDSILISYIQQLFKVEDNLFILASKGSENEILKFDINGKFVGRIGRPGNGPGEYNNLRVMTIDTLNKRVIAVSQNKVLIYSYDGSFKTSYSLESSMLVMNIYFLDEVIWLFGIRFKEESRFEYFYNCYDQNFLKKDSLILGRYTSKNLVTINNPNIISETSKGRFFYFPIINHDSPLKDTLYHFTNLGLIPAIKLDFSSIADNKYPEIETSSSSIDEFFNMQNLTISAVFRTDNYLFTKYNNKNWSYWFVYNLNLKTGNIISGFPIDLFIQGSKQYAVPIPLDLKKGEFYFTLNGVQLEGQIEGVDENSNPVIFFLSLKE